MRILLLAGLVGCGLPSVTSSGGDVVDCDLDVLDALDNQWPVAAEPPEPHEEGFNVGQFLGDYELFDQNGDEVRGCQFAGRTQVIDFSALWCGPCQELACFARSAADDWGDDFVYTTVISQDGDFNDASEDDVAAWANLFELHGPNTPVLRDYERMGYALDAIGGSSYDVPLLLVVDPDLTVMYRFEGTSDAELRAAIADVTGVDMGLEGPSVCD